MQTTAESGSVPTKTTVSSRLADATGHRVDELTSQYRRVTGERCDASDPEEICVVLTEWIRENESVVQALLDDATATFDGISLDDLEAVFEMAWNDGEIGEGELVAAAVRQQAEAYEKVRDLLGGEKPVGAVAVGIRRSPGRATGLTDHGIGWDCARFVAAPVDSACSAADRGSEESETAGADDDAWAELQRVAEELRRELPNADVTDDVTAAVDADDRPTDERATELLGEAEKLLSRIRAVRDALDDVDEGSIVLIEGRQHEWSVLL